MNTLTLLDGREIVLYPLLQDKTLTEYIEIASRRECPLAQVHRFEELRIAYELYQEELRDKYKAETKGTDKLLVENVRFLVDNADKILSDSRMFLAPLPKAGGLAYCSSKDFDKPVLGTYLLWWKICKEAHPKDDEWVYYISGSPLTGMNSCGIVNAEGKKRDQSVSNFMSLWKSFIHINKKYQGLSDTCEHYTLPEVIEKLNYCKLLSNF